MAPTEFKCRVRRKATTIMGSSAYTGRLSASVDRGSCCLVVKVVKDCPTSEAGEYAAYALGSLACDNLEIANLMVQVTE